MGRRWGTSLGGRRLLGRSVEGPPGGVRSRKGGDGWPGFEVRLTWWVRLKDAVKRGKDQERRREYALCLGFEPVPGPSRRSMSVFFRNKRSSENSLSKVLGSTRL
jgi:hypothetical protein